MYYIKKRFYRSAKELRTKLNLKTVFIVESDIIPSSEEKVFELHHLQTTIREGYHKRKLSIERVMKDFENQLKRDFIALAEFQQKYGGRIITTTHTGMIEVWKRNAAAFKIEKMNVLLDDSVGMNLWRWAIASFTTTGRLALKKRPKQWATYEFFVNKARENIKKGE